MIKRKQAGKEITPAKLEKPTTTTNLMDALRASLQGTNRSSASSARKRVSGKTHRAPARRAKSVHARKRRAG
jgi:non-homologous end joining protein Ku